MYFIDKTNRSSRAMNSRREDYQHMEHEAKTNPDPGARRKAQEAIQQFRKEQHDSQFLSMRQSLINAHREGNKEEIKDIQDIVSKKKKYQNE